MATPSFAGPSFADMLKTIEDRSAALRAAATAAGPEARVPGCPDWSVRDLVAHLGEVQRFWAATVSAGPADAPPGEDQVRDTEPTGDLMAWSAASTAELVRALAQAGPDVACWTWWTGTGAPATSGAVARHQVQEAGVHAFDAQEAAGRAEPLPRGVAADGIGEFLTVGMATMGPWPQEPGSVALAPADAATWIVGLDSAGARAVQRDPGDGQHKPGAWVRGTASDIVLALYGRHLRADLVIEGDRELATGLLTWTDNE
jgi:uncharacterized protein (TIGR03083 family)